MLGKPAHDNGALLPVASGPRERCREVGRYHDAAAGDGTAPTGLKTEDALLLAAFELIVVQGENFCDAATIARRRN